ncbi:MAG TPA: hypothetical protein VGR70_17175 [Stellaceae bacterium]|nr:hypothetical protein [Stellaceae bacterium]
MTDTILKKAMEKRDAALREAERWDQWIRCYGELSGPAIEELDIPMTRSAPPMAEPADEIDLAPALRKAVPPTETKNGKGLWLRAGGTE